LTYQQMQIAKSKTLSKGVTMNKVHLIDCMEFMKGIPDKYYELAIVDPPYRNKNQPTKEMREKLNGCMKQFGEKPTKAFFDELFRISQNQIIWGANNFIEYLYSTNAFIFWYKRNPMANYSDGELAWTSFNSIAKCLPLDHFGAHNSDFGNIIHPTQKPVALYKWLLKNYAKPGDKIFDSHVGSGSIRIACHDMGFDFEGCEIDKDYWEAQEKRYQQYIKQGDLFSSEDTQKAIYQGELF
jgi:site-specific DNA-methyltransferase (adenine-specific)